MTTARAFGGSRFPAEVVLWVVGWYLQSPISYRELERMLADRGVKVDHVTLHRWTQRFAPELGSNRCLSGTWQAEWLAARAESYQPGSYPVAMK